MPKKTVYDGQPMSATTIARGEPVSVTYAEATRTVRAATQVANPDRRLNERQVDIDSVTRSLVVFGD